MRNRLSLLIVSALLSSCATNIAPRPIQPSVAANPGKEITQQEKTDKAGQMVLPFIENKGEYDPAVKFYAQTFTGKVLVTDKEIIYELPKLDAHKRIAPGVSLKEVFSDASKAALAPKAGERSDAVVNFFLGNDKRRWRSGVETYKTIKMGSPWKGIELELIAHGNSIEKLFTVAPYEDPSTIVIPLEGMNRLTVDPRSGALVLLTELGTVQFSKPIAYQIIDGVQRDIDIAYTVQGTSYGFSVGEYDRSRELVIDPFLASTYYGGSAANFIFGMAQDSTQNLYVVGYTASAAAVPLGSGYSSTIAGGNEILIARLLPDFSGILNATFIGGTASDIGVSVAVDQSDNVYVAGQSSSSNYPTTSGAYCESFTGSAVVVSKFTANLTSLLASTCIPSNGSVTTNQVITDGSSGVVVLGATNGSNYPTTTGAFDEVANGGWDVFVTKLNSSLTALSGSTLLGGTANDFATEIARDSTGNLYLLGSTSSTDFPVTSGSYDESYNGGDDAFVSRLSSSLATLSRSTFLGGDSSEFGAGIALNASDQPYVVINTSSTNYPATSGAYDESANGGSDAAVTGFNSNLSALLGSTFIGGSSDETPGGIAIDYAGDVYIGGRSNSSGYPTTAGVYDTTISAGDGVISRFNSGLTTLIASTFFGGSLSEDPTAILLDNRGHFYVTGYTLSADYPTTTGVFLDFDLSASFINNGFVTKGYTTLSTSPPTVNVLAVSSPTANGTYSLGSTISIQITFDQIVTVTGTPQITLETGTTDAIVNYSSGSGSNVLSFEYTTSAGHTSADLDYVSTSALTLNGGRIRNSDGDDALLTLPSPGTTGSLGSNKNILIDTATVSPSLTSPSTGTFGRDLLITYSLPESPTPGSVRLRFINGSSVVVADLTLNNATSNSFTEDIKAIGTDNPSIVVSSTASSLPDGTYTVTLAYQDAAENPAALTSVSGVTIDTSSPTVTISSSSTSSTRTSPIPVTFTFSKAVSGFLVGDITVTNGAASNFSGSGTTYSADITPTADGSVLINVGANVAQDALGNLNSAATQLSRTYDSTTLSPTLTSPLSGTGGATFSVSYSLGEAPLNGTVALSFINASNSVVATATLGNSTSASFTLNPKQIHLASGVVSTTANSIPDGVYSIRLGYRDSLGNSEVTTTNTSITVDTVAPGVVISSSSSNPTNSSPIPVTITFSEPVSGFTISDITAAQGTLSNFSGSNAIYSVSVTPNSTNSAITLNIASNAANDGFGNANTAASQFSISFDSETAAPVFVSPDTGITTNSLPIEYILGESPDSGSVQLEFINASSVTVAVAVLSDQTNPSFDIDPRQIHVSPGVVSTSSNSVEDGVYSLRLSYQDALENPAASVLLTDVTIDSVNPTVAISSSTTSPTAVSPIPVTITFSKPVYDFSIEDITATNATLSNFLAVTGGSGPAPETFSMEATPSLGASTVSIDIPAGAAVDSSGNLSTVAVQFTRTVDSAAPSVVISSSETSPTASSRIPITILFSETVTGFVLGDISAVNAQVSNFGGSGNTYTAELAPLSNGTVSVAIAGAVATDLAGNGNSAATIFTIDWLRQSPAPTITTAAGFKPLPVSKILGIAQPNAAIELFSSSRSLGTTTANSSGNWSIDLTTALSGGTFTLTATAGSGGAQSERSESVVLSIPAMPLDFNNDGISDVVMFSAKEKAGSVRVITSGLAREYQIKSPSILPAVGDYDGDGAADLAVISKGRRNFDWNFINRESAAIAKEQFGSITSTILIGCSFDSSLENEMASFAKNTLIFKRRGGPVSRLKFPKVYSEKTLRGCGDVDRDGVAELLFNTTKTRKVGKKTVKSIDLDVLRTNGQIVKTIAQTGKFHRAFVGDVAGDDTSDIAIQRSASKPLFIIYDGDTDRTTGQFSVTVPSSYAFGVDRDLTLNTFHLTVQSGKAKATVSTRGIKTGTISPSSISITGKLANSYYLHAPK